jgi:opacity protein-like surface antigen
MKAKLFGTALLSTVVLSLPVAASDFYVLADAAQSKFSVDGDSIKETGFTVGGGYKFNETFALELAYRDLGSASEYTSVVTADEVIHLGIEMEFTAIQAALVAQHPLSEKLNIFGRVGIADLEVKATGNISDGVDNVSETDSVSKNKAVYGVGLGYVVSPSFTLRAEYSQYAKWEGLKVSTLSLGFTYQF